MLLSHNQIKRIYRDVCPHIIIDNFLPENYLEFVSQEVKQLQPYFSREGYNNKKTLRDQLDPRLAGTICINEFFGREVRKKLLYSIWDKFLWTRENCEVMELLRDGAFGLALHTRRGSILVSDYGHLDGYGYHIDSDLDCCVTAVLMHTITPEPRFYGGRFMLFDKKIPFKRNRLVLFPSCMEHAVEQVKLEDNSFDNHRFTIQYFISATKYNPRLLDE